MADDHELTSDNYERLAALRRERLRQAMGWDDLPEITEEQRTEFEDAKRRAQEEALRCYGQPPPDGLSLDEIRQWVAERNAAAPPCDCGHAFSAAPGYWHLDWCAFRGYHLGDE